MDRLRQVTESTWIHRIGGQGTGHLSNTFRDDIQTMAICDVDADHRARALDKVNKIYAEKKTSGTYKGCDVYSDFQELLAGMISMPC